MKAQPPKSWHSLPEKEKVKLQAWMQNVANEVCKEQLHDLMTKDEVILQKVWLKMMCVALYRAFSFDDKQCMTALGQWKYLYHKVARSKTNEQVNDWLDNELLKVFPDGYPQAWVDSLAEDSKDS